MGIEGNFHEQDHCMLFQRQTVILRVKIGNDPTCTSILSEDQHSMQTQMWVVFCSKFQKIATYSTRRLLLLVRYSKFFKEAQALLQLPSLHNTSFLQPSKHQPVSVPMDKLFMTWFSKQIHNTTNHSTEIQQIQITAKDCPIPHIFFFCFTNLPLLCGYKLCITETPW